MRKKAHNPQTIAQLNSVLKTVYSNNSWTASGTMVPFSSAMSIKDKNIRVKNWENPHHITGEFIGFRQWNWQSTPEGDDLLMPVGAYANKPWEFGHAIKAKCEVETKDGHRAPEPDCSCGFYMYSRPEYVISDEHFGSDVAGIVKAWGRLCIHPGEIFRAEHVQTIAIFPATGQWANKKQYDQYKRFANRYEIDVIEEFPKYRDDLEHELRDRAIKEGNLIDPKLHKEAAKITDAINDQIYKNIKRTHSRRGPKPGPKWVTHNPKVTQVQGMHWDMWKGQLIHAYRNPQYHHKSAQAYHMANKNLRNQQSLSHHQIYSRIKKYNRGK